MLVGVTGETLSHMVMRLDWPDECCDLSGLAHVQLHTTSCARDRRTPNVVFLKISFYWPIVCAWTRAF